MLNPFLPYGWASTPERIAVALAVTVGFAVAAHVLHGVNRSGMIAGGASCFLLFAGAGPLAFASLVALFVLTWATTRIGYRRKQALGVAERGDGRTARQVLANLAVAALCSIAFATLGSRVWLLGMTATLAEAAADTVASEVGQSCSQTALLITTWKAVPAGTDGGITSVGTLAGIGASLAIASIAVAGKAIPSVQLWIPALAGLAGMLVDSLLGATLQRRGWISNEAVNLLGTVCAAGLALSIQMPRFWL